MSIVYDLKVIMELMFFFNTCFLEENPGNWHVNKSRYDFKFKKKIVYEFSVR